jgi:DNA-binding CsgD family transcriptional regulator
VDENALLDRIYEAAIVPEGWPRVLDDVASLGGATGSALFVTDHHAIGRWTASSCLTEAMEQWIGGDWGGRSQRMPRMMALRHPGFVTEYDLYAPAELEADPSYTEFLRPRGMGWGAGTFLPLPGGGSAVISVERALASGPMGRDEVDRLDAARPHLARAAMIANRIGLERARSAMAILDTLALPAALLNVNGSVVLSNDHLDRADPHVTAGAHGKVILSSPAAQAIFHAAIKSGRCGAVARSIPLPAHEEEGPAVLHLFPLRRAAQDLFSSSALLIVLTRLTMGPLPEGSILEGLFDLTPAEAKLTAALCSGASLEGISADFGVSRETLRTQLKHVFSKTGTKRQADLVNLLSGARRPA